MTKKKKKLTKKQKEKRKKLIQKRVKQYLPLAIVLILLIALSIFITVDKPQPKKEEPKINIDVIEEIKEKDGINIKQLQETYQNEDIVGYLRIPEVIELPIVKTIDNEYYLNHLLNREKNIEGTPFIDYRVNFGDRKILIYGHSGKEEDLPFLQLHKYEDISFYEEHPTMYLYSEEKKYTYEIFSYYLETKDYDYVNIQSFGGLTWLEHLEKLKNKSNYSIPVTLTDNSKILILQTCEVGENAAKGKYKLLIGVLTKEEDNNYA